jgi:hypothetical protein
MAHWKRLLKNGLYIGESTPVQASIPGLGTWAEHHGANHEVPLVVPSILAQALLSAQNAELAGIHLNAANTVGRLTTPSAI